MLVMRSPTDLATVFRDRGMKLTPQRQLLFRLLHENEAHPSAEALFAVASEQMPGISLRTVYQTLTDLDGFTIESTDIVFRGVCAVCAASIDNSTKPTPQPVQRSVR